MDYLYNGEEDSEGNIVDARQGSPMLAVTDERTKATAAYAVCSKGVAEPQASRSITTVCQEAEPTANKSALQQRVARAPPRRQPLCPCMVFAKVNTGPRFLRSLAIVGIAKHVLGNSFPRKPRPKRRRVKRSVAFVKAKSSWKMRSLEFARLAPTHASVMIVARSTLERTRLSAAADVTSHGMLWAQAKNAWRSGV